MSSFPADERQSLHRLARLVAMVRNQGTVPTLLSVLDGWQGHLRVQVQVPGEPPWVGVALARGEQVRDPTTGMPHTLSVLVQGPHGVVDVPVACLEALEILPSEP